MDKDYEKLRGHGVFANPKIDFAFKRSLGSERYKDATIGLLNSIITDKHIDDVTFVNTDLPRETANGKSVVVDIICTDSSGDRFIVEMQTGKQPYFMHRMSFYYSRISSNIDMSRGETAYNIHSSYVIAFLKFDMGECLPFELPKDKYSLHFVSSEVDLGNEIKHPGSPEFYYFDLTRFHKTLKESNTDTEIWLSLLNESQELEFVPQPLKEHKAFAAFLEALKCANFSTDELIKYESEMLTELDLKYVKEYAAQVGHEEGLQKGLQEGRQKGLQEGRQKGLQEGRQKGLQEGRKEGRKESSLEIAKNLKTEGLDVNIIAKCTGLSVQEIEAL